AVGIDYSVLRPRGDVIGSTGGFSSGAVSFMTLFDKVSEVISEGSLRRGANMGVLRIDHPDIEEFIDVKKQPGVLEYFNVSVGITDKFMEAVINDETYGLINPKTKKEVRRIKAKDIWDKIVYSAWKSAEPGMIFLDEIARKNPTPHMGDMTAVNLCGEQPLLPWESCNLANIKLTNFIIEKDGEKQVDWDRLEEIVKLGIRFLDNCVEAHHYFYKEIEDIVKNGNRKVGLGIMAFADMLMDLGIPYNSDEALEFGGKLMQFIHEKSVEASEELAKKRGNFKNFKGSKWEKMGYKHMRNATLTTVAPTGSASVIANCSSGIEPVFALAYTRYGLGKDVKNKEKMFNINERLVQALKDNWVYSQELMEEIVDKGSIQNIKEIPDEVKKVFVTAMDVSPDWHVKMQGEFQKHVDSAITKTINLPSNAKPKDVEDAYLLAYKLKCKGITVYRDQSRHEQVLTVGKRSNYTKENKK
ncbi:MAG TPA: adenosylcobalamin-dependent ribonucleoside-diphosphate reductase, partial [Candidatus Dojkabacteria bacterium]